jgi:hypothetical protein
VPKSIDSAHTGSVSGALASKPDHWAAQWCLAVVYDPGLVLLETDPLMDPLRNEPRFQAIERQLKFPS